VVTLLVLLLVGMAGRPVPIRAVVVGEKSVVTLGYKGISVKLTGDPVPVMVPTAPVPTAPVPLGGNSIVVKVVVVVVLG